VSLVDLVDDVAQMKLLLNTTYPTKAAVNDMFPSRTEVDSIASALSIRLVDAAVSRVESRF
jgi:hypothetical protein